MAATDSFENDKSMIEEKEFRRALDRCYSQSQNANICKLNLEKVPPRNNFEKLLEEVGAELRANNDNELSVYLSEFLLVYGFLNEEKMRNLLNSDMSLSSPSKIVSCYGLGVLFKPVEPPQFPPN